MDRRLWPANDRVASDALRGQVDGIDFVNGAARQVAVPVADLRSAPRGNRDRQLQMGQAVCIFDTRDGWSFVQSDLDGYCGYVENALLGENAAPTHRISTRATHIYSLEDFKSAERSSLSFGASVAVVDERRKFFEIAGGGFIPKKHLRPLDRPFNDPATLAQLHFGTPYLWGGNSSFGIDCSGLIQAALIACSIDCPADSDQQMTALGADIPDGEPLQRNDILFWTGHVGLMVDADTMIHANAHHMAVAYEPIMDAIVRIEAQGDGPVIARKRL